MTDNEKTPPPAPPPQDIDPGGSVKSGEDIIIIPFPVPDNIKTGQE
jgi:hypothetical protein